ncbi:CAP domain-containing protein, partial [Geobacter sp.]
WKRTIGENVSYGPDDPRTVVIQLIIDDGVPGRGHRKNIYSPAFGVAGVACAPHPVYGTACAIDFAGGFKEE